MEIRRHYVGPMAKAVSVIAISMSVYHILFLSHVFDRLGIQIYIHGHRSITLLFIILLVFLSVPAYASEPRNKLPWYDLLIILGGVYATGYPILYQTRFQLLGTGLYPTGLPETVGCILLIIIVLEAARRTMGWAMVAVALFFLIQMAFGRYFPSILEAKPFTLNRIVLVLYCSHEGIMGVAMGAAATVIVLFIIFASFLRTSGAGDFFIDLAMSLAGRFRGGPAKVAVIASSMVATFSGSGLANVATTGTVTIPLMKSIGYRPEFAGAVEAVASNGGQITPPVLGTVAFLMAEILRISYWEVVRATVLPALLYYIALYVMVDIEAVKIQLKGVPQEQLPSFKKTLFGGAYLFIPLALLVYLMMAKYDATTACLYSILSLIPISFIRKKTRMGPRKIIKGLENGGLGMIEVGAGCASAGVIIAAIMLTGLGFKFSSLLTTMVGDNSFLLLVVGALASFILGMGMTSIPCYVILAMMVGPALVNAGFIPIAAHLFFFYWGILSFITPPVAICAYFAAAIARSDIWKTGWIACRLGIVSYLVPFIFIYNPALLLIGNLGEVILATITGILGAVVLAYGVGGYMLHRENIMQRVMMIASGILLIIPGLPSDILGLVLGLLVFLWQRKQAQAVRATASLQ